MPALRLIPTSLIFAASLLLSGANASFADSGSKARKSPSKPAGRSLRSGSAGKAAARGTRWDGLSVYTGVGKRWAQLENNDAEIGFQILELNSGFLYGFQKLPLALGLNLQYADLDDGDAEALGFDSKNTSSSGYVLAGQVLAHHAFGKLQLYGKVLYNVYSKIVIENSFVFENPFSGAEEEANLLVEFELDGYALAPGLAYRFSRNFDVYFEANIGQQKYRMTKIESNVSLIESFVEKEGPFASRALILGVAWRL